tara:strand:+ start:2171 stop:3031 length:861 start_codon:yes stop_codon:yes gene_type:complete
MADRYITEERMQKFLERGNDMSVSNVAADEIQATVGKGRGLGSQTRIKKSEGLLKQAEQNLYDSSVANKEALDKRRARMEASQQDSINDIVSFVIQQTEKETYKTAPLPEGTLGDPLFLTSGEKKQRGFVGPVVERLMTTKESGSGGYDALYDQSQKSTFKDFKPTEMTVGEVLAFQKKRGAGSYASFVKANNPSGKLSTPVGKFQYVGSTLQDEVDKNDYDLNAKFDAGMQSKIFYNHANRIIKNLKTQEGKRSKMRATWEGFKSKKAVSDKELDALIAEIQSRK